MFMIKKYLKKPFNNVSFKRLCSIDCCGGRLKKKKTTGILVYELQHVLFIQVAKYDYCNVNFDIVRNR